MKGAVAVVVVVCVGAALALLRFPYKRCSQDSDCLPGKCCLNVYVNNTGKEDNFRCSLPQWDLGEQCTHSCGCKEGFVCQKDPSEPEESTKFVCRVNYTEIGFGK